MSRPVTFLHIGLMKTGTTYIQQLAIANRAALAAAGVHFAGSSWPRQVRATQELLGLDQHDSQVAALSAGAWKELATELRERRDGASLVSMEFLSFARRPAVSRLVQDLGDVELQVILSVRDTTSTIPAQWQTSVTSGKTHTWADFRVGVQRAANPLWRARAAVGDTGLREFRRTQDVGRVLHTWSRAVPPERLHVVTVPLEGGEPDLLWRRFAQILEVDPRLATEPPQSTNPSLGLASTELVRRVNVALDGIQPWDYNHTVKSVLAARVLSTRRHQEQRPRLDEPTARFARAWNQRSRQAIAAAGARVSGSLEDLPVSPPRVPADDPGEPGPIELLEAARAGWIGLTEVIERRRRRVARLLGANRPEPLPADPPRWLEDEGSTEVDVDGAVTDLTALVRTAIQLRRDIYELNESSGDADDQD